MAARRGMRDLSLKSDAAPDGDGALTVSGLTRQIKALLQGRFNSVAVEGEISTCTISAAGHLYLSLKDEHARLDVVMWRNRAEHLHFTPETGARVVARGEVSVYEPRGSYQLVADSLRPVGKGDLQERFEALVRKLRAEGLFLPEHKQPLPALPATVGVVTSPTGAAVRDIITILRRRMPGVRIVLSPCLVQGPAAAADIASALERIDRWGECEVLIVGRGGGSQEDLRAFNEEAVARAIFATRTPVVSAVGHEVDTTIADLVADRRAATPSEAAETVVPDLRDLQRRVMRLQRSLASALSARAREARGRLKALLFSPALRRPMDMIRTRQQLLDETADACTRAIRGALRDRLQALALASARLEGLSPLSVLGRGYSVTISEESGRIIRRAGDVKTGDRILTRLATGMLASEVREVSEAE